MNILVTGGAGYIGSMVCRRLIHDGNAVTAYDSLLFGGKGLLGLWDVPSFHFIHGDIRDANKMHEACRNKNVVIHLAALVGELQCMQNTQETEDVNFLATWRLANQIKAQGSKFVFASTCSNYGISEHEELMDEDSILKPLSLYADTKIRAENEILKIANDNFKPLILRFATAYGLSPRMRFDLLLNEFVRDAIMNKYVLVYGASSWRPFVHVYDIARFIKRCLHRDASGIFNVGGDNLRKSDIVTRLQRLQPELSIDIKEGKKDPRNYRVDFTRARREGFIPMESPDNGIESIAAALRAGVFMDPHSKEYRNA